MHLPEPWGSQDKSPRPVAMRLRVMGKVRIMYMKAHKHMYNRRENGTEVDESQRTTETGAQGKEGATS